jgi:hypothetical protein
LEFSETLLVAAVAFEPMRSPDDDLRIVVRRLTEM